MHILKTVVSDCFTVHITKLIKQSLFVIAVLLKYLTNNWRLIMKLTNLLSVAVATMVGATSLTAMDAEFATLNPTQAKMLGSQYKRAAAAARPAHAHHAHLAPLAGRADTDFLLESIGSVNCDAYINDIGAKIVAAADAWFDLVVPGGNPAQMLNNATATGVHGAAHPIGGATEPANLTVAAFKAAFAAKINTLTPALLHVPGPVDGSLRALSIAQEAANMAIQDEIEQWIDLVVPGGDATQMLNGPTATGVNAAGHAIGDITEPADLTVGAFKKAFMNVYYR